MTTTNEERSGGQLLVTCLKTLGARKCFGVPGESYLAVLDALHDTEGELDFVLCRNEGGAAYMSEAYAKLTGQPGICFVTRGPGASNAAIGIHTAMQNSSPLLLFVGQVDRPTKDREAFQELDYRAFFGSVAKWVTEVNDVNRIAELVSRAWATALSGRPGPVVVALPEDVLTELTPVPPCRPISIAEPAPSPAVVKQIEDLLTGAKRPLLLIGGASWSEAGCGDIQRFAETNRLPVVSAFRFNDLFDNHHECYAGNAGVGIAPATKRLVRASDLILAVNVRFGEMTTAGYSLLKVPNPRQTLIHAHASDRELGKVYAADLPIHSGPNTLAAALANVRVSVQWDEWASDARAGYEATLEAPAQPGPVDMGEIMRWLQENLPQDAILANGAGNFTIWPNKFFQFGPGQRLLAPQSGAMGYGVPAAVMAKVVQPHRTVVCFSGDGDFQMNCQELGTAMQAGAQPIYLVINNGMYGTIRMHQERHYPARITATTLQNPSFVVLARAYGCHAETVGRTEDFGDAFDRARSSNSGALLELMVSPEAITPDHTLTEIRNQAL